MTETKETRFAACRKSDGQIVSLFSDMPQKEGSDKEPLMGFSTLIDLVSCDAFDPVLYQPAVVNVFRKGDGKCIEINRVLNKSEIADILEHEFNHKAQFIGNNVLVERVVSSLNLQDAPDTVAMPVKGWKAVNNKMEPLYGSMMYEIGKDYSMGGIAAICSRGYHFCRKLSDVFNYHPTRTHRVFEVEASGRIVHCFDKSAATKIRFVRELSPIDMMEIFLEEIRCLKTRSDSIVGGRIVIDEFLKK